MTFLVSPVLHGNIRNPDTEKETLTESVAQSKLQHIKLLGSTLL